jgi:hypothetical protein
MDTKSIYWMITEGYMRMLNRNFMIYAETVPKISHDSIL